MIIMNTDFMTVKTHQLKKKRMTSGKGQNKLRGQCRLKLKLCSWSNVRLVAKNNKATFIGKDAKPLAPADIRGSLKVVTDRQKTVSEN